MATVTIKAGTTFDGEYPYDQARLFNGDELHLIKQFAGVRLFEIEEASKAGDYDLIIAVAVIAVWREGKLTKGEALAAAELVRAAETGAVEVDLEADAGPPALAPLNGSGSETVPVSSSKPRSPNTNATSDRQEKTLSPTGGPG